MKKKVLAGLLALMLTLSLAACGGTEDAADGTDDTTQETTTQPETEGEAPAGETEDESAPAQDPEAPAEDEAESGNTGSAGNSPSNSGTGTSSGSGTSSSGGQNTSSQRPAQETPAQKPAEEPVSQPTTPPAEETAGSAPETPTEDTGASTVDLAAFAASVTGDQTAWPGMMALEGEALSTFYAGLSAIATKQCVVQVAMISASGDEIALVEVENSADVQAVKDIFQARIDYQVGDGTAPGGAWYPEPTEMWKNQSRIVSNGNFVMLVAHSGADSVVEQFNALFA